MRGSTGELAVPFAHAAQDKVSPINHDPCYHELHDLSNTIVVLVFSKLICFVRMILQREENKGVEFTVCLCEGSEPWNAEGEGSHAPRAALRG